MAAFFLHLLCKPSSKSHLCTHSCCFSTWFHTWIIQCFLPSLPLHFCSSWMSVLEHILPLLHQCPCLLILPPQIPALRAPFPPHVLTLWCALLLPFSFWQQWHLHHRNFSKVIRGMFWKWFFFCLHCTVVQRMQTSTLAVEETISSCCAWSCAAAGLCQEAGAGQGLMEPWLAASHLLDPPSEVWELPPLAREVMLQLLLSTSYFRCSWNN